MRARCARSGNSWRAAQRTRRCSRCQSRRQTRRSLFDMPRAVGQFRELVESCTKDAPLQEALKKALNFTAKGWEAARAHALRAVSTDNRMRVWVSDDSHEAGALFRCHLGRVDLDAPVGAARAAPSGYLSGQGIGCRV